MRLRSERIVTPAGTVAGEVSIEDGQIVGVDSGGIGDGAVDLGRLILAPGYIDMHVHGGGGAQCNSADPDKIAAVARFTPSTGPRRCWPQW